MSDLFGRKKVPVRDDRPLVEHPDGSYKTALEAITYAMKALESIDSGDRWIRLGGQGRGGGSDDSYQMEEVYYRKSVFDLRGETLDLGAVLRAAGLKPSSLVVEVDREGRVTLPKASPQNRARFLDAVFRQHFGIIPHDGEDDYAFGAEWAREERP